MEPSLAHLAGFFDGEGSIGIYSNGNARGRTLRMQITQNKTPASTDLLECCRARWGGCLSEMNRSKKHLALNYQASGKNGAAMLVDLRPHLLLKIEQADAALAWWEQRPKTRPRDSLGRMLPLDFEAHHADREAEMLLKSLKAKGLLRGVQPADLVVVDAADPVGARHIPC